MYQILLRGHMLHTSKTLTKFVVPYSDSLEYAQHQTPPGET